MTLTLSGYLRPSAAGELVVPMPLLERFAAEPALIALDTAPVEGRVVIQVRFAFAGLSEFRRWSEEGSGAELLRALRAVTIGGSLESHLAMRPARLP